MRGLVNSKFTASIHPVECRNIEPEEVIDPERVLNNFLLHTLRLRQVGTPKVVVMGIASPA